MGFKVFMPEDVSPVGKDYLSERGYEIKIGSGIDPDDLMAEIVDCHAVLVRTARISEEVLKAGKELRIVARHGVGYDDVDVEAAARLGIWATNAPLSNANSVAEHTLALMLAAAKNIFRCGAELRRGNFGIRSQIRSVDLENKTLGIIGLGRIGSSVAKKAALGLDMKVIGYDPYLPQGRSIPGTEITKDWERVFRFSDFVSLHVPATTETLGLVGEREFGMMKPTAYLINCARGEVVREKDLIEALKSGTIAGAALDVYHREPPEPDNPLLSLDNVTLTPHNASQTNESIDRMGLHAAMEIDRVLSGGTPEWPVNKPIRS